MGTTNASSYRTGAGIIWLSRGALALAALAVAGCTFDRSAEGDDDVDAQHGVLSEQIVSANGLSPNGLSPNGLSPNGLSPNGLSPNGLSPNGLSPNGLSPNGLSPNGLSPNAAAQIANPGLLGDSSRRLLKYTVGCALNDTQSFAFQWTDALGVVHNEKYMGLLGLAPSWADGPLNKPGQRWVSACLAARTNRYETSVMLSLRGNLDPLKKLVASESVAYPHIEGAFWGNLFSAQPYLHACYDAENVANSRARLRDCAAGQVDTVSGDLVSCANIEIVGECEDLCSGFKKAGSYYSSCEDPTAPGNNSVHVITSALP